MAKSLEQMANEGMEKLTAKAGMMAEKYNAAKSKMIANYEATPFGPNTKNNYTQGINNAVYHAPDPDKWKRNWLAAMSR